jgi:hypothetical protein
MNRFIVLLLLGLAATPLTTTETSAELMQGVLRAAEKSKDQTK